MAGIVELVLKLLSDRLQMRAFHSTPCLPDGDFSVYVK